MPLALDRRATVQLGLAALGASFLTACGNRSPAQIDPAEPGSEIELISSDVRPAAGDPTLVPQVVAGLQTFSGRLYDALAREHEGENLVLSPFSVLVALGMTLTGAAGRTAAEMREVLGADDLGERWHAGLNALTRSLHGLAGEQKRADGSSAEVALASADQLFGQQGVAWEQEFVDLLAKEYGAPMRAVDFVGDTERARRLINDWVEAQTADRITDLVPEGVLDVSTRLVLVNAIYLKAPWEEPFEKTLTTRGAFRRADGSTVQADLMRRPDVGARLTSGKGWRAVTLPYAGRRLAMTVVLPDDTDDTDDDGAGAGLAGVERRLAADGLAVFTPTEDGGETTAVDLTLPRWTFRTAAPLREVLAGLGMPTAFTDAADFTPMTEEDLDLVVSEVLHQAFVAVDEEGTEAAAATAVVMTETSAPLTEAFVVDRPFLFVVHDVAHGAPLFVGRVTDPTA
ncbi:serpin family protein [Pimelobacter simplex]|uniref:serpin family protein n=1 Tax=Nocardioides simplex TaxID=2045 RepID=UPI00380D5EE0